jgi:hypothetical protein
VAGANSADAGTAKENAANTEQKQTLVNFNNQASSQYEAFYRATYQALSIVYKVLY